MECSVEGKVVAQPPPSSVEQQSNATMSTPPPNLPESESPKATDLSPNQPASESPKSTDLPPDPPAPESTTDVQGAEEEEEEEEGECGFCLFMKAGGCKDAFVSWEDCVKEAEDKNEDLVEKCSQVTALLKQCMDAHSDYYEPILRAEKHAEEQAVIELEKEKQQEEGSASNNNNNEQEAPNHSNQK